MLILTRKRSELIRIGEDVIVKVIRTGKSTVKIGIEAPAHVRVLRGELTRIDPPASPPGAGPEHPAEFAETAVCSDQFPHVF
jgi:carbon storage regulator CsrA